MAKKEFDLKDVLDKVEDIVEKLSKDKDLKKQADELFSALGLNMSTAMGVFCRQAVRLGKIPFELAVDTPNAETLAAIDDVNNNRNMSKAYDDMAELMRDLNA